MAVEIVKFKVRMNGKTYEPGGTIDGLSENEEALLISKGYAVHAADQAVLQPETGRKRTCVKPEPPSNEDLELQFDPEQYLQQGNTNKKGRK